MIQHSTTARFSPAFDVKRIREDFPILSRTVRGRPLVYLDNAATTQKPRSVVEAITRYYEFENANIHRGVHALSEAATEAYEGAREAVRRFINAASASEVVFVRGTTEGLNLLAQSYVRPLLKPGDEVLISVMEHHSNIVPWQMVCQERGAALRVIPMSDSGELLLDDYRAMLNPRVRVGSLVHVSNALGTINPAALMTALAHEQGIPVILDGAQAAPHMPVDVQALGCDFYVFSGHKVYGPTGIGIVYGREHLLEAMPPYQGGGDMIRSVTFEKTVYNHLPYKFEAGTPHIAGAVGLGAAIAYLQRVGLEAVAAHESEVLAYATNQVMTIPGVHILGTAREKAGVLSFTMADIHPHDVGTILDTEGVAIRAGHHCAQPLMARCGVSATARASLGLYNTRADIDVLVNGLRRVHEVFG